MRVASSENFSSQTTVTLDSLLFKGTWLRQTARLLLSIGKPFVMRSDISLLGHTKVSGVGGGPTCLHWLEHGVSESGLLGLTGSSIGEVKVGQIVSMDHFQNSLFLDCIALWVFNLILVG